MDANTVRGLINQVLYPVHLAPDINDEAFIERMAQSITAQKDFSMPPEQYAEAIGAVLRDGHLPVQAHPASKFYSDDELLVFLRKLADRLPT
jgi:hypothetical protein